MGTYKVTKRGFEMTERVKLKKQKSPVRAILMMCYECMGGTVGPAAKELIKNCASTDCPLYDFRFGVNPYNSLTGRQRGNASRPHHTSTGSGIFERTPDKAGVGSREPGIS